MTDDEKAKLRFELANENVQSISQAQAKYVTALLTYIAIVWALFFLGGETAIDVMGLHVGVTGVWTITPFVTMILTLAYIGSVTAAIPAVAELQEAAKGVFSEKTHSLFELDTHKNIVDYLARLQMWPFSKTRTPADDSKPKPLWRRLHQLILPAIFVASALTSCWALYLLQGGKTTDYLALRLGQGSLIVQVLYSLRPVFRNVWRMFGASPSSNVYH